MTQNDFFDERETPEDISVDELIRSAREELDSMEEPMPSEEEPPAEPMPLLPEEPEPSEPQDFEPDFGNAFDGYGEYAAEEEQAAQPPSRKKRTFKRMRFPVIIKIAIYAAVVVALAVLGANYAWKLADDVLALTRPDQEVEVVIRDSDGLEDIANTLKDAGAIKYEWLFKLYCKFSGSEDYFDPGVYMINLTYDYHALVNNLMASAGSRETATIMVIEGADCQDIFALLDENGICTQLELEETAAEYHFDYEFLQGIPYGSSNRLEGYLFPDTYEFYLNDDPEDVLNKFLQNYNNRMDEDLLEQIENSEYSMYEILTIASIIEAEAANDGERADVSAVIYNRLRNWDVPLLNMDSTVYYGAVLEGTSFSIELDSPYNTYLYPGLPAGPICNPGINSIRAALNPSDQDYYYFATGIDGRNRFFDNQKDFMDFLNSDEFQSFTPGE